MGCLLIDVQTKYQNTKIDKKKTLALGTTITTTT